MFVLNLTYMEANPWALVIVGAIVLVLLVLILIKNFKDRREFYESLNASEDLEISANKNLRTND